MSVSKTYRPGYTTGQAGGEIITLEFVKLNGPKAWQSYIAVQHTGQYIQRNMTSSALPLGTVCLTMLYCRLCLTVQ